MSKRREQKKMHRLEKKMAKKKAAEDVATTKSKKTSSSSMNLRELVSSYTNKLKVEVPKSNQQVIGMLFNEIEGDIFRIGDNLYSVCYEYTDISFVKATDEDAGAIFIKYVDFLNSFTEKTHVQISCVSTPVNAQKFKAQYVFDEANLPNDEQKHLAREFNQLIDASIGLKKNTLLTRRYITVSQEASSFEEAQLIFKALYRVMDEKFKDLKSSLRPVSADERLALIHDFFNLQTADELGITSFKEWARKQGLHLEDVLAPKMQMDLRNSDYIEMTEPDKEDGKERFLRCIYMDPNLPTAISPKFFNQLTGADDIHMITTINIQPCETTKVLKKLKKRKSGLETERHDKIKRLAKQGVDYNSVKDDRLESAISDNELLIEDIQYNDQKVFEENIVVCLASNSYFQLEEQTSKLRNLGAEMLIQLHPLKWQQLEGIQNTLPLGHNSLQFQHMETSEATAVHVPFSSKDFLHEKSIFFGTNLISKNPIFLDRTRLINGNGCILATSGAGKSFQVKTVAEQILLRYPSDEVIFIDFQREYGPIVQEFGGQTITIANNTDSHINPLDMSADYSLSEEGMDTPLKAKTEYMQGWVESIIDEGQLDPVEKTVIDRCVRNIFFEYEQSSYMDKTLQPKLSDFYAELAKQPEAEAHRLAKSLERFVFGALDMFAYETNVDIHNRVVNFDVSGIPESIQTAGYLVILDHIMNRLIQNRKLGINTWVFIDEFHILLANPSGAEYVAKLVKIGRKYNALITVITQNIADVYNKESGRKILGNAEFALILKQKATDREMIQSIYDISNGEARYFGPDAKRGQGVIVYGSDKIPFYSPVPTNYRIYELNNTDSIRISRI
jgi:hypothetical protein